MKIITENTMRDQMRSEDVQRVMLLSTMSQAGSFLDSGSNRKGC